MQEPAVTTTLDVWDEHLASAAAQLLAARLELLNRLRPHLAEAYAQLTDGSKLLRALYRSSLQPEVADISGSLSDVDDGIDNSGVMTDGVGGARLEDDLSLCSVAELTEKYRQELVQSRTRELERGMSLTGPHRDEVELLLGAAPARGYASHGESWSIALSLRLASFHVLDEDKHASGNQPLDAQRRRKLALMVASAEQVLVTAAVGGDIPEELAGSTVHVIPGGVAPND